MIHYTTVITNIKYYRIDDTVRFTLNDGEECEALAVKETDEGMLFILTHCLKDEMYMYDYVQDDMSYKDSDMRKYLNNDILDKFPEDIKLKMLPFANRDYLRLPTEEEMFGNEDDTSGQLECMKLPRNRVAALGIDGYPTWYWSQDKSKNYSTRFASVDNDGYSGASYAASSYGVRPLFLLRK